MKYNTLFIGLAVFLCMGRPLAAQNTIRGKVSDIKTGKPIPGVNVYLANSTIGASTNSQGFYTIDHVPNGLYQLVFSMVSYQKKITRFKINNARSVKINMKLQPRIFQMREMSVTGSNKEWKKNYTRFREEFIGKTRFAQKTKVVNKTVLRFEKDPGNGDLLAHSKQPLKIENEALGYKIYVELSAFEWSEHGGIGFYKIYPHFKEMKPKNKHQKKRWQKNRRKAYRGSFRNFMKKLYEEKLNDTHFHVRKQYKLIPLSKKETEFNLLGRPGATKRLMDIIKGFRLTGKIRIRYGSKYSVLVPNLKKKTFFVDNDGNLLNPLSLKIGGHWAEARLANQLPLNYQ